ncbi:ribosomal protein L7/L12 [Cohnella sp. GCM10020058]|uniref:ribosomal protein L7/L12 n=1 Tax=Cohnella sp. GCM10020058 TaxID=3317330 RepID=UPI00362EFC41
MDRAEVWALISLLISIILMIRLIGLHARLNELKYDIARLEGRPEAYPAAKQSAADSPASPPLSPMELTSELEERLQHLVTSGKRIEAIKVLREATGLSLKGAKDYVDTMRP